MRDTVAEMAGKARRLWKTLATDGASLSVVFLVQRRLCCIRDTAENRDKIDKMLRDLAVGCVGTYDRTIPEAHFVEDVLVTLRMVEGNS